MNATVFRLGRNSPALDRPHIMGVLDAGLLLSRRQMAGAGCGSEACRETGGGGREHNEDEMSMAVFKLGRHSPALDRLHIMGIPDAGFLLSRRRMAGAGCKL